MSAGFRSANVVGRIGERAAIEALLQGAAEGRGGCLVLEGEPGIGKSRLASLAVEAAEAADLRILQGRTSAAPGAGALRPIAEAVAAATRRAAVSEDPRLAPYLPILARFAPALGAMTPVEAPAVLVGEAVMMLATSGARGALVVVEDLHWADPDTLGVVEYVADQCRREPIAVLVTTRPGHGAAGVLVDTLEQRGSALVLRLGRLSEEEEASLAASCLGVNEVGDDVRRLLLPGEGLPLLVEDLLADAAARGLLYQEGERWVVDRAARTHVPPGYAASVERRLQSLDDGTRAVLSAAAVLGRTFEASWLPALTGLGPAEVEAALRAAADAQILEPGQFRHALTREAVLGTIPAGERSRLAGVAASYGEGRLDPGALGELYAVSGQPDRAAPLLLEAAAAERRAGTLDAAVRLTARAHELAQDPALAQRAALARVDVLAESGRYDEARGLAGEVLPYLDGQTGSAVQRRLARAALRSQDPHAAATHLDLATNVALDGAEAEVLALRAEVLLESATAERLDEAEDLARRAVEAARRASLAASTCAALLVLGRCARRRDLDAAEAAFQEARFVADAAALIPERISALAELGTIQMLRDVKPDALLAAHASAVQIGALVTATGIAVNLAGVRLMTGELAEAVSTSHAAREQARRFGMRGAAGMLTVFEGAARGFLGDLAAMESLLAEAEHDADPDILAGSHAIARATVALLQEDRDRALRALGRADAIIRSNPVLMIDPAAAPTALLAAVTGKADGGALDEAEARSGSGSAWTSMWVDSARAVLARDTSRSFDLGIAAARRYPVFGLVAQRLVAEAQVRDGWGDPVPWLVELEQQAIAGGYDRLASACRSLRRKAGVRVPRGRAVDLDLAEPLRARGITAREAEVLALMPSRPSNAEIARRLFLSPRTVEKHVAALLQKTGATDRVELGDLAGTLLR